MSPEGAEVWSTVAERELFGGWRRWSSFSFIWIWSCVAGILSQQSFVENALPHVLGFSNSIVLLFCVLALVGIFALGQRVATACGSRLYIIVGALFLVVGSALLVAAVAFQSFGWYVCGAACGGFSIGMLKVAWGEMFSLMPLKQSMASMGYALISSSVIVLLTQSISPLLQAILACAVSLPLGYCLYTGSQQVMVGTTHNANTDTKMRFSLWVIAVPVLVGLSYGIFKVGAPLAPAGGFLSIDIATAGVWANLLAGVTMLVLSRFLGTKVTPARIVVADMVVVVAGLLLLAAPRISTSAAAIAHELGFSLFYFFMIVYWGDLARRMRTPVIPTYTAGYLAMMAGQLIGGVLGAATGQGFIGAGDMTLVYALVFAFFLCVAFTLGSSPDPILRQRVAVQPEGVLDHISAQCERLADKHALTPREREVLNILARGHNASHIAESLVISLDTAKSHMRNIYRKLDIHTQQELLDLVE